MKDYTDHPPSSDDVPLYVRAQLAFYEEQIKLLMCRVLALEEANARIDQRHIQQLRSLLHSPWKAVRHG